METLHRVPHCKAATVIGGYFCISQWLVSLLELLSNCPPPPLFCCQHHIFIPEERERVLCLLEKADWAST